MVVFDEELFEEEEVGGGADFEVVGFTVAAVFVDGEGAVEEAAEVEAEL